MQALSLYLLKEWVNRWMIQWMKEWMNKRIIGFQVKMEDRHMDIGSGFQGREASAGDINTCSFRKSLKVWWWWRWWHKWLLTFLYITFLCICTGKNKIILYVESNILVWVNILWLPLTIATYSFVFETMACYCIPIALFIQCLLFKTQILLDF